MDRTPIDAIALRTELKRINQLEQVGGVEYLRRITESVPHAENAAYYAGVVRDRQRYRQLISDVERMRDLLDEPLGVDEQVQEIQRIALGIEASKSEIEYFEIAEQAINVAGAMRDRREMIATGFRNIDRIIQGVAPGELIILAGRPSMGKSALVLDIALNMAKAGKSVLFFTLEMPYEAVIERALCNQAQVNMATAKTDDAPESELEKLYEQGSKMRELDFALHEAGTTAEKQIAFIRTRKKMHKLDVVFIDYLQLMNSGHKSENRVQEISTISRKLKLAAVQEQVPIIALSQLNRQVEAREKHRPRLSDLRESGALEQDADIVMLLHREDYYRSRENPGTDDVDGSAEVIVAKNRRGPTGIAELTFLDEYVKFGDLVKVNQ